ncbi:MAG: pentapeptide repeat-containing protein [Acidimicrobiales bacterium]
MWRVLGLVVVGVGVSACHQNGTVFAVDTTADTVDVVPGDGVCADAGGACSLRAAVMEANALPGVEEIRLVDGAEYTLTIPEGTTDTAATGDLDITAPVVMTGDGLIQAPDLFWGCARPRRRRPGRVRRPRFLLELLRSGRRCPRARSACVRADFLFSGSQIQVAAPVRVNGGSLSMWSSSIGGRGSCCELALVGAVGGTVYLENVTLDHDRSRNVIRVVDASVHIRSSTVVGGKVKLELGGAGALYLQSSLVDSDCSGTITSVGHNLLRSSCALGGPSDQVISGYPTVGPLADHGGEVLTIALAPRTQAVDGGPAANCAAGNIDARGGVRPWGPACDIGAFEMQYGLDCGSPGPGADLRYCDLSSTDLSGIDLSGADLRNASLDYALVVDATLVGADLTDASLVETDLSRSDLTEAVLERAYGGFYADDANFTRATLRNSVARTANRADFTDADAVGFDMWTPGGSMTNATVEGADFTDGSFWGVTSGGLVGTPAALPAGVGIVNGYMIDRFVVLAGLDFSGADFRRSGCGMPTSAAAT